jgi:hypothetical protein
MKTTVVPAQVTTVEDKVAGNLSFTQLLLVVVPVFLGGAIFTLVPPFFGFTYAKMLVCSVIATICITLAIRIKGKILLSWVLVLSRYGLRPRLYLFNKNDAYLRRTKLVPLQTDTITATLETDLETMKLSPLLATGELARAEAMIADPDRKFHLKSNKGVLRVVITQVKKESI